MRQERAPLLDFQPLAHLIGQCAPRLALRQNRAHARGKISRERKFAAFVGRHFRIGRGRARDVDFVLDQRLVFEDFAGEHESVAHRKHLDEIFLDLAEQAPAARNESAARARAHQPHFQHVGFDDGADIHAVALRHARMGDAPAAVLALADFGEALIGFAAHSRRWRRNRPRRRNRRARASHRARRRALRRRVRRPETARRPARPRICCASTSSAPVRRGGVSCAFSATASMAARHSSTSKRLAGTSTACDGSSSR